MGYSDIEYLWAKIQSSDVNEMDAILSCVLKRYSELASEIEMVCLFRPKNDMEERERILTRSVEFLLNHPGEDKK